MVAGRRVFVAVSGGVDSSTAAAVLKDQGYDCSGVFMKTGRTADTAADDAQRACEQIGIPFYVADLAEDFENRIIAYFTGEYRSGRTPNPCVLCNRVMKFGKLWQFAREHGADFIATGHYAKIKLIDGMAALFQAADTGKDQSYVLSMIRKEMLGHTLLPMAETTKRETRALAVQFGLHVHNKADSQEICFVPDDDYAGLLRQRGLAPAPGNVIDTSGRILGKHDGIYGYTIGQRRGLKIALGRPMYVVKIDTQNNTIVLGEKNDLMTNGLSADDVNWLINTPAGPLEAVVKIRYNHKGAAAVVYPQDNGNCVRVEFAKPVSAVTPGQAAVFYIKQRDELRVAGGGWICPSE